MPFEKGQSGNPTTQFQPGNNANPEGRIVGSKNRATLFKKWLETSYTFSDPTAPDGEERKVEGTIEDALVLGLIMKGAAGDASAAREVLDSVYGKQDSKLIVDSPKKTVIRIGAPVESTDGAE